MVNLCVGVGVGTSVDMSVRVGVCCGIDVCAGVVMAVVRVVLLVGVGISFKFLCFICFFFLFHEREFTPSPGEFPSVGLSIVDSGSFLRAGVPVLLFLLFNDITRQNNI